MELFLKGTILNLDTACYRYDNNNICQFLMLTSERHYFNLSSSLGYKVVICVSDLHILTFGKSLDNLFKKKFVVLTDPYRVASNGDKENNASFFVGLESTTMSLYNIKLICC